MSSPSVASFGSVSTRQTSRSGGVADTGGSAQRLRRNAQWQRLREVKRRAKEVELDVQGLQGEVEALTSNLEKLEEEEASLQEELEGLSSPRQSHLQEDAEEVRQKLKVRREEVKAKRTCLEETKALLERTQAEHRSLCNECLKGQAILEAAEADESKQDAALQQDLKNLFEDMLRLQTALKTLPQGPFVVDDQARREHSSSSSMMHRIERGFSETPAGRPLAGGEERKRKEVALQHERDWLEKELGSARQLLDTIKKEEAEKQARRKRQRALLLADVDRLQRANAKLNEEVDSKQQLEEVLIRERDAKERAQERMREMQATLAHMKEYQEVLQDKIKAFSATSVTPWTGDKSDTSLHTTSSISQGVESSVTKRLFPAGESSPGPKDLSPWEMESTSKPPIANGSSHVWDSISENQRVTLELVGKEKELAAVRSTTEERLARAALEVRSLKEKADQRVHQLAEEQNLRSEAEAKLDTLMREANQLKQELQEEQELRLAGDHRVQEVEAALSGAQHSLHAKVETLSKVERELARTRDQLEKAKAERVEIEGQLQQAVESLQGEAGDVAKQLKQEMALRHLAEANAADLASELEVAEGQARDLKAELERTEQHVAELALQLENSRRDWSALSDELARAKTELETVRGQSAERLEEAERRCADLARQLGEAEEQFVDMKARLSGGRLSHADESGERSEVPGQQHVVALQAQLQEEVEARKQAEGRVAEEENLKMELVKTLAQLRAKLAQLEMQRENLKALATLEKHSRRQAWHQGGHVLIQAILLAVCLWALLARCGFIAQHGLVMMAPT